MHEKDIRNWSELTQLIDDHKSENWLYRGVTRKCHDLVPSIGRVDPHGQDGQDRSWDRYMEQSLLEEFKRQALPKVSATPRTVVEWMALGQHHGLKTRLLDWTESVLVAAFFATEHGMNPKVPPAIYGIRNLPTIGPEDEDEPFQIESVALYRPALFSERISPQQSVFTIHPKPKESFDTPELIRWTLAINGTLDIKLALDASGITRAALFPDIDGLAASLNWQHKWGRLRS